MPFNIHRTLDWIKGIGKQIRQQIPIDPSLAASTATKKATEIHGGTPRSEKTQNGGTTVKFLLRTKACRNIPQPVTIARP